jgi:hypothetical protein
MPIFVCVSIEGYPITDGPKIHVWNTLDDVTTGMTARHYKPHQYVVFQLLTPPVNRKISPPQPTPTKDPLP